MVPEIRPKFVLVARILRARGNKGEVFAELTTDFPERLKSFAGVFVGKDSDEPRRVALQNFWMDRNHPGYGVFHFAGSSSISEAEALRGLNVLIPFEQRVALPDGKYVVSDLIGCTVFEIRAQTPALSSSPCSLAEAPAFLGAVRDVYFPGENQPGTPLLSVETPDGELLIPLAEEICRRIDVAARRIEVALPEGLREVNDES